MQKTLGGDRLGSGKKDKVYLHNYERSTHDLGYLWRSTMAAGTLVPFMSEVALPGDTFDINLDCNVLTHPTIGPLFGSYKVQLDIFQAPIRLYQGQLHNNKLGIGMNMSAVKLPQITLYATPNSARLMSANKSEYSNAQISPSCILSYLNIRGVGAISQEETENIPRTFNGIPLLAYWDIYKNYYSNKQEGIGYVIHNNEIVPRENITSIDIDGNTVGTDPVIINPTSLIEIQASDALAIQPNNIIFYTSNGIWTLEEVGNYINNDGTNLWTYTWKYPITGAVNVGSWAYKLPYDNTPVSPKLEEFDLEVIDNMREKILADVFNLSAFDINAAGQVQSPYRLLLDLQDNQTCYQSTQEGLGIKTYQSDLFNNWLSTEWLDGPGGINEITAIDTSSGSFNIDTFILSKKVYDMLNRIAVSGGTYDDWLDAVYTHERILRAESPIYHGGLIKELVFQEVINNSASSNDAGTEQPLGTLAGKGRLAGKHKGGSVVIKVDEPSYIIGIVSLTPRLDYSQGNKWDVHLATMDDFHKPQLDQIGFQELITEQMAWFDTQWNTTTNKWEQKSAGKQPAWINYMTNVNQVRGNFAIPENEMFMTLNRNYEYLYGTGIKDLTTYIDPVKFNQIFAQTEIDAQNFWTQIAVDITARRKMSAKVMPNL